MPSESFLFPQAVLAWYDEYGRKSLPWKQKRIAKKHRAYHIWLSEVMLQQTQVATVIPYYWRFIKAFPSIEKLATASQDEVLSLWTGLGYYARGRNLHKAAQQMWQDYQAIPNDFAALLSMPGIGRSTAGAIMAQAFDSSYPILDGNVKRVLARFHAVEGWPGKSAVAKKLWQYAEDHTPGERVADYTQAIMDLGALVCTRSKPKCNECPLTKKCSAFKSGRQALYPTSKPKKEKPVKSVHVLCLLAGSSASQQHVDMDHLVLLEQRPPTGIWGGLWSFPEFETLQMLDAHLAQAFGLNEADLESLASFRHSFSHYHLDIQPHVLRLSNTMPNYKVSESEQFFVLSDSLKLGLPAPIQKLLRQLS